MQLELASSYDRLGNRTAFLLFRRGMSSPNDMENSFFLVDVEAMLAI